MKKNNTELAFLEGLEEASNTGPDLDVLSVPIRPAHRADMIRACVVSLGLTSTSDRALRIIARDALQGTDAGTRGRAENTIVVLAFHKAFDGSARLSTEHENGRGAGRFSLALPSGAEGKSLLRLG